MRVELIKVWAVMRGCEVRVGVEGPEVDPLGLLSPYTGSQTHLSNPGFPNNTV